MKKTAVSISPYLLENVIILLFSLLPVVDSANGILVRQGGFSVGSLYKVFLCAVLFLPMLRTGAVRSKTLGWMIASVLYILFSVSVNLFLFHEKNLLSDFVIKLIFNIATFALLLENRANGALTSESFFRMLNNSAWLLPVCYLIPYALGLGHSVYGGSMGYKAFFIAQNELSLIIIVLFYFCLYKLTLKLRFTSIIQTGLLFLCGLLLNTKSTILACILGAGIYVIYIFVKLPTRIRLYALASLAAACGIFYKVIIKVCSAMVDRFTSLLTKHYSGSFLTAVLSGRDYLLENAWDGLLENNTLFRLVFGNGFCSSVLVEMDIVDIFFYLGIVGAVFVLGFFVYIIVKCIKNCRSDPSPIRFLSLLLIFVFLNITGHVLFMAMSGCYFVLYLCYLLTFRPKACNPAPRLDSTPNNTL